MWRRVGREEPQRVHGGWDVSDEITNATLAAALQRGAGPGFRWLTADEVGNVIQEAEGLKADSFVKVIAPSAYAWLFAFGSSRGAISSFLTFLLSYFPKYRWVWSTLQWRRIRGHGGGWRRRSAVVGSRRALTTTQTISPL